MREFNCGDEAEVYVYLPGIDEICSKGKIIRKSHQNKFFSYNFQFIQMDDGSNARLSDFLNLMDENNECLISYYLKQVKGKLK